MSWNDVSSYIKTQLKPGVLGNTDVQKILNAVLAIVNQIAAGSVDPQNDALWKPDESYAKDVAPVLWMDQWLVSNVPNNIGNVPISTSGTVHPTWRVIGASSGGGIAPWSAIIYPNVLEIVFYEGAIYYLDRAIAGNGPFASTNFVTERTENKWKTLSGSGGGGGTVTAAQVRDMLQSLIGNARLDASAIKGLPEIPTENRIINPGVLTINSPTSATLADEEWSWNQDILDYTGLLVLSSPPASPNRRFDIITLSGSAVPSVESGIEAVNPVMPSPADPSHLVSHVIYRPFDGDPVIVPVDPKSPATAMMAGLQGKYAPIWRQSLIKNATYGFKISFLAWSSEYGSFGQWPMNGMVLVNFDTGANNTEIDPNRVTIRTVDIGVDNKDFMLVQTGAAEATLYARKKSYLGNMAMEFVLPKDKNVKDNSLVNGGTYGDLPLDAPAYPSYNGRDYVSFPAMPVRFDVPWQMGYGGTKATGPITFPPNLGDAGNMARADTNNMAKLLHNDTVERIPTAPAGVTLVHEGGEYIVNTDNHFKFICHKDDNGKVTSISYTIAQNQG
jgi:hypothetical protein